MWYAARLRSVAQPRARLALFARQQSYLDLLYLSAAPCMGLVYWFVLAIGIGTGLAFTFLVVGLPILVLMGFVWWWLAAFERALTMWWLNIEIAPMRLPEPPNVAFADRLLSYARNRVLWTSLLYLTLKLPYGAVSLTITGSLLASAAGLAAAPLIVATQADSLGWPHSVTIGALVAWPAAVDHGAAAHPVGAPARRADGDSLGTFRAIQPGSQRDAQRLAEARDATAANRSKPNSPNAAAAN